jgi:hypothetical protein
MPSRDSIEGFMQWCQEVGVWIDPRLTLRPCLPGWTDDDAIGVFASDMIMKYTTGSLEYKVILKFRTELCCLLPSCEDSQVSRILGTNLFFCHNIGRTAL